ncbi:MAG: tryptophan--tRNA ligase [Candidatus Ryanbacteria bacterium RIFCSPHIGHO2_02_FULL_45_43]|uniref:Tryptophan--tRNA ligase n=1 Tax=Candidatus Ryanbacteria bacterium RIFCSPHIGHO2_01_45_13 TaxID=1802112 RepID=A0A1G2FU80_9BACT|nr:MAG: tryptophan--tRNA ligase [Candidatus Ryanbacteria bacterium RIFCSPHIGHO2_01_45_13]OGZ41516.1 MAG: tryptophan--tRNA ligase [Candidatus Ryanbacteria bacterium RIFCSPHIGHO2_01_FULL_44_130]OGZ47983.1 MAG: tryptophan--tRNA ligase [Candidatus Ryanbacteria bacterium RIFCSPHIGHO2_02_FULL_45_43]OGZ50119.1 MAG: tryptophan--tRNA ligase [Candidatus Ryanbacteria bacterium RIFCSPHIGHO2_12_FULL_44_20]OGZ51121.1 MAG: tryptophan--tRNA ligase [Candidatus Ryanbacteria bacterium RIFCSPLOWO2_01_FULL_44_230]
MSKQVLLTGMRPTSHLHVGNYFGALKNVVELQKQYKTFLMIADLHALTTLENTKNIAEDTLNIAALYIAGGINPKKVTLFIQSAVPEQAELATLFNMITPVSMLELNPVYKEMLLEHPKATNLGLLAYPVLQAADILAYKATVVPVGKDQSPHIELAREIARRFNYHYGKLFLEPKTLLQKELKILSLKDPNKKMSKSHEAQTHIGLLDSPKTIHKKIKSAVTDSGKEIVYDPFKKPAISNLMMLMRLASGTSIRLIEKKFQEKGYAVFKESVADALIKLLAPMQERYNTLAENKKAVQKLLETGSKKARIVAAETLKEAKQKIGLL